MRVLFRSSRVSFFEVPNTELSKCIDLKPGWSKADSQETYKQKHRGSVQVVRDESP